MIFFKTALAATIFFWAIAESYCDSPAPSPENPASEMSVETATEGRFKKIYVIPIRDEIQKALVYVVRRGVKEAIEQKSDAIILHIKTPGGEGEAMQEIMEIVQKFEPNQNTYTLVDDMALSAGAFISASTRHIYMVPGSTIGAASPVIMGSDGPAELPEKFVSAYAAMVRAAAERNGHRPEVFDAMVNKLKGLTIDDVEILAKGDILTLTADEAVKTYGDPPRTLLARAKIDSLDSLVKKIAAPDAKVIEFQPNGWEQLARGIVFISPLLMTAAIIFGYIEFQSPGFGLFGFLAVACALVFYFGHYVAGLGGHEFMILFFCGLLLIALELILLPGTLLFGLLGACIVLFSFFFSMVDRFPTDPLLPEWPQLELPILNMIIALALSMLSLLLLARSLPRAKTFAFIRLEETNEHAPRTTSKPHALPGDRGIAQSYLRPSGIALIGDEPTDVLTEGDFIEAGTPLRVTRIEGAKIYVEKIS